MFKVHGIGLNVTVYDGYRMGVTTQLRRRSGRCSALDIRLMSMMSSVSDGLNSDIVRYTCIYLVYTVIFLVYVKKGTKLHFKSPTAERRHV